MTLPQSSVLSQLLKQALYVMLFLVFLFTVGINLGLSGMHDASVRQGIVYQQETLPASLTSNIYRMQLIQAIQMMELGIPGIDEAGRKERIAIMDQLQSDINAMASEYESKTLPESLRTIGERFVKNRKLYYQAFNESLTLAKAGDYENMAKVMKDKARPYGLALSKDIQDFDEAMRKQNEHSHVLGNEAMQNQTLRVSGILGVALLFAAAMFWFIRQRMHATLGGSLDELSAGLVRIGHLDLTGPTNAAPSSLVGCVQNLQQAVGQAIAQVGNSAEIIAQKSSQIASDNQDLGHRVEQQVDSLQQVSTSTEQLSTMVQQNANNARQANQLAQQASNVAAQGGEVVSQVVGTMKEINTSSRRIADIIGVIDGIAFQTNILALNAAVEAARAGEQGRGFAVVASEVRALAGRSAEAAKEIKTLIGASVERVEQGTLLADRAGSTMQEVVDSIRKVSSIVSEISSASAEQAAGVMQVGQAITSMDGTTQQNATLVEEMSAISASLKTQADELVNAVQVFKLHPQPTTYALPALPVT